MKTIREYRKRAMKSWQGKAWVVALALLAGMAGSADASVVVSGTRVIYPADKSDVPIGLTNRGQVPALVHTWLDDGDPNAKPKDIKVPFTVMPAVSRLDPDKKRILRLVYTKEPLPQDRESLFWLNVLDIPPTTTEQQNRLQIAFRTRIKVFFRPQGLPGKPEEAPVRVRWELVPAAEGKGYALKATNPTPYYVNLDAVALKAGERNYEAGSGYVEPNGTALFPVVGLGNRPAHAAEVDYISLDDWGAAQAGRYALSSP